MNAIDELVKRSKPHPELQKFYDFHQKRPQLLDFLVEEIRLRISKGFKAFSYHSLCQYARWKIEMQEGPSYTFKLNDHRGSWYARAITILHPEFNGCAKFRKSFADSSFGTRLEPVRKKRPKNYARRLQWADGTPIQDGWRPSVPHVISYKASLRADVHTRETGNELA